MSIYEGPMFSPQCKLIDLEKVIKTRTPVWDIGGSGDVRVKLDTDINDQEWYVFSDSRGEYFTGKVECWAFPHFNGSHDTFSYVPVAFCFKTFAELLEAHHTERAIWAYDVDILKRYLSIMPDVNLSEWEPMLHSVR